MKQKQETSGANKQPDETAGKVRGAPVAVNKIAHSNWRRKDPFYREGNEMSNP